jgi:hypothetical protein
MAISTGVRTMTMTAVEENLNNVTGLGYFSPTYWTMDYFRQTAL